MDAPTFELERWFAKVEAGADVMLAESGVRSLPASDFDTDPGELGYVIPTNGERSLRATIGERYGRDAEEVVCTVGTQEANYLAFRSLLSPGDHAVVVTPTYESLHAIPESICDVTRVELDASDWTLDVDAVADAIRPETELVVLNNPNNPTGRQHDAETVDAVYDLAADADAYLLGDEVYRQLSPDPAPAVASLGEHGLSTAGLSKSYGLAGCRFGWLAGAEHVVEDVEAWKDYTSISPGKFGHHVAEQVFGVGGFESRATELRQAALDHVATNAEITASWAREHDLGWDDPVGCNVLLEVPEGFEDSRAFCRTVVEEASVVLAPGDCFGVEGTFRLGFGLPTAELREGLERVAGTL
jgi:aspartate/methionine/tyrosine aminotransferase